MKKYLILTALILILCSCTSTYQSTKPNSVWLKVECDNSHHTYTMWMALPSSGQWGDPVAKGTFSEEEANDSGTGHMTKTLKFHHSETSLLEDKKGIGSLSLRSTVKDVVDAVETSLNKAVGDAVSHDMIELEIDEKTGEAEFQCSLLPVGGLSAEETSDNPWK